MQHYAVPVDQYNHFEAEDAPFKFSNPSIRNNFIRKVYLILCTQLVFTAACVVYVTGSIEAQQFYLNNFGLILVSLVVMMVSMYALVCFQNVARAVPWNYLLLAVFTMSMAFTTCLSVAFAPPELVLVAAVITAAVTVGLTIYAFTTKTDFTMMGGSLFIIGSVVMAAFFMLFWIQSRIFEIILLSVVVVLYGFYLIYDTQLILGGRSVQLEIDDYILGALSLYVDIIRMFTDILQLLQAIFSNE